MDAYYGVFSVDDASTNYILTVSGFTGNCGDSLVEHNGQMFSTRDRDNDNWSTGHCAGYNRGGFWYFACQYAHPTGIYYAEADPSNFDGLRWVSCYGDSSARVYILKFKRDM